jgi:hypothetical protein
VGVAKLGLGDGSELAAPRLGEAVADGVGDGLGVASATSVVPIGVQPVAISAMSRAVARCGPGIG